MVDANSARVMIKVVGLAVITLVVFLMWFI